MIYVTNLKGLYPHQAAKQNSDKQSLNPHEVSFLM